MDSEPVKSDAAKREEETLAFWKEKGIFEKTLSKASPKGEFVFYDGPPFANGLPHYGHLLTGTIKDAIPRYKTMRGYHVPRRWGWDCHGLPVENEVEKDLGTKTKRDIEAFGIGKFNDKARTSVMRYAEDWKNLVPRFGRFVDMENDYRTMDATYTKSVWWAFKSLHDKGLLYEGFKAMQLCPRCGTTLSNFEVAQGYKDITDLSVTVKLRLENDPKVSLLAWTTTPWTLPGNMAAAINADATYSQVKIGDESYILAKNRLAVLTEAYEVEKEWKGKELVGMEYVPPFPYFASFDMKGKASAWKVYAADFVTLTDGTGIVHIAPAFGADDLALAQKENIPILHHVSKDGYFIGAVTDFKGMQAKPKEDAQATDVAVIKYLAANHLLFSKAKLVHSYPHCWRCDTPLLNYASSSWFVKVTDFRDKLVAENKKIDWIPAAIGQNRFGDWLENARDWAISRARYWGAPIPVWKNEVTGALRVIGSVADLKKYVKKSGNKYFVMRHGQADHNLKKIVIESAETSSVTEVGCEQIRLSATKLKKEGITRIYASPFLRARQTAELVADTIGFSKDSIVYDERLREYHFGSLNGKPVSEFFAFREANTYDTPVPEGESHQDAKNRFGSFLYDLEKKDTNEKILIITHGIGIESLSVVASHLTAEESKKFVNVSSFGNAALIELSFIPMPHNENYELDLHRPGIDDIHLVDTDSARLVRVPDVFDCWFESGSMAYAQQHYPFENRDIFEPRPGFFGKMRGYPADFIAEGLDQTRGWFYSLLVLGIALFNKAPYKNVIVNGIVLAEDGQKMSKRLKNYPDPAVMLEKYGADPLRYYLLSSPLTRGEDLNFSEKGVAEISSKLIGRFVNVLSFYEMYANEGVSAADAALPATLHILDRWIIARLNQTIAEVTAGMDTYELDRATRPLVSFIDDLSTWYLRRSRDRLKEGGEATKAALAITRYVLETFSKIAAPFTPFTAEYVYGRIKAVDGKESVHLSEWPLGGKIDAKLIDEMEVARTLASEALMLRQKANLKVRQPLASLSISGTLSSELAALLAEEVNVQKIIMGVKELSFDTVLTPELIALGDEREMGRAVAEARKVLDLSPRDKAEVVRTEDGTYSVELSTGTVKFNLKINAS